MLWRIFEKQRGEQPHAPTLGERGTVLARECEEFLSGELASGYLSGRGPVPHWAWINFLAHAPETELRSLAENGYSEGLLSLYDSWRYAECTTACAVFTVSEACGCSVAELQRRALVPLELELATLNEISPDEFEQMVYDALSQYGDC